MEHSILNDVKKLIGPSVLYSVFDPDIIIGINSAFFTLFQLGVGNQKRVFTIADDEAVWSNFSKDESIIAAVKQYVYLKARIIFDPPTSSYVLQMYQQQIQELEWRLREMAAGMFEDEDELILASKQEYGYVEIGEGINVSRDGQISVDEVPPLKRGFVERLINNVFGLESEGDDDNVLP